MSGLPQGEFFDEERGDERDRDDRGARPEDRVQGVRKPVPGPGGDRGRQMRQLRGIEHRARGRLAGRLELLQGAGAEGTSTSKRPRPG
jgi:hypothetical protein